MKFISGEIVVDETNVEGFIVSNYRETMEDLFQKIQTMYTNNVLNSVKAGICSKK